MTQTVLEAIQEQEDAQALWALMLSYFHDRGIARVSYHHFSPDIQDERAVTINADGFSQEWVCHYIEKKLYTIDPITELAQTSVNPFRWSDVRSLMSLSQQQSLYLTQMRDAGVGDGLAFQVYGPGLRNGYVGLGVDDPRHFPSDATVLDLHVVAQAGHLKFCALHPVGPLPSDLSPRERQILHWIARGKSNGIIADILSLSPHTVDTMVRRIFAKLGVSDRTTAAIQGVGAGLIHP